jgi:hypothetical protein
MTATLYVSLCSEMDISSDPRVPIYNLNVMLSKLVTLTIWARARQGKCQQLRNGNFKKRHRFQAGNWFPDQQTNTEET